MMERTFIQQKLKEFQIQEFIDKNVTRVGHSFTQIKKTPLGEKVIIHAARPGAIVGRKGENIKSLTRRLKQEFGLDSPEIEIAEVDNVSFDPRIVAERIVSSLERYGAGNFKGAGHKMIGEVMRAGAKGVEITISGKVPGARARRWRFYQGYLKKCGDVAVAGVRQAYRSALLKPGIVGIQVKIMPPDLRLPDDINVLSEVENEEKGTA